MKIARLTLPASLLLMVSLLAPSPALAQPPSQCERQCKADLRQCVKDTGDRPVCEAGYAFCLECCTGGCLTASAGGGTSGLPIWLSDAKAATSEASCKVPEVEGGRAVL